MDRGIAEVGTGPAGCGCPVWFSLVSTYESIMHSMSDGASAYMKLKIDVLLGEFQHTSSGRSVFAEVIWSTLSQQMTRQPFRSRRDFKLERKID